MQCFVNESLNPIIQPPNNQEGMCSSMFCIKMMHAASPALTNSRSVRSCSVLSMILVSPYNRWTFKQERFQRFSAWRQRKWHQVQIRARWCSDLSMRFVSPYNCWALKEERFHRCSALRFPQDEKNGLIVVVQCFDNYSHFPIGALNNQSRTLSSMFCTEVRNGRMRHMFARYNMW